MKRTCNRCKALTFSQGQNPYCQLRFKIDPEKISPMEECPKPTTNLEFVNYCLTERYYSVR